MSNKGAALLHTIRQVINDDTVFRQILRGLNKDFYHRTVDSKDVEKYFSDKSGKDPSKIFDQYLRTVNIPQLEYKVNDDNLFFRWTNCVKSFNLPIRFRGSDTWLYPVTEWKTMPMPAGMKEKNIQLFQTTTQHLAKR